MKKNKFPNRIAHFLTHKDGWLLQCDVCGKVWFARVTVMYELGVTGSVRRFVGEEAWCGECNVEGESHGKDFQCPDTTA